MIRYVGKIFSNTMLSVILQIGTAFDTNDVVDGYSDPIEVNTKGTICSYFCEDDGVALALALSMVI